MNIPGDQTGRSALIRKKTGEATLPLLAWIKRRMLNNFFTDRLQVTTIDTLRIMYFLIFLIAWLFTEAGRNYYRPYIYDHDLHDFGFADTIGNLGGIIVEIFFGLALVNATRKKGLRVITFLVTLCILYESFQQYLPHKVFDWKDIIATLIGGSVALILFLNMPRMVGRNQVIHRFAGTERYWFTKQTSGKRMSWELFTHVEDRS
ncbi:MAG: hypothetical protein JW861_08405 [Bacteroidales bacterium]|nr:hypothetical protein [Bacteroidales bacterium]